MKVLVALMVGVVVGALAILVADRLLPDIDDADELDDWRKES